GKVLYLPVSMKLEDLLSRGEKYRGGVAYPTGNDGYLFSLRRGKVEMITTAPCLADGQGVTCMSVVVRHPEDLTVVYGNLNKVEVREGDIVKSGQQIGAVDTDSASPKVTIKASRNGRMIDEAELLTTKSEEAK
ncbi:MAG: peptidoglycan DD-metalloendopeptidase family protein, partial [Candidatus Nanoarchaeia archaeon]